MSTHHDALPCPVSRSPASRCLRRPRILLLVSVLSAILLVQLGTVTIGFPLAGVALARGAHSAVPMVYEPPLKPGPAGGILSVSQAAAETLFYGGTVMGPGGEPYAAEPSASGWANRKAWTWSPGGFNGTPHSGLNMDGWVGVGSPADTADHFHVQDASAVGSCVIAGNRSLFCGLTAGECADLCYKDVSGTGYGDWWRQAVATRNYVYDAGYQVGLSYDYSNETEWDFDSTHVKLQVYSALMSRWEDHAVLVSYSGTVSGSETIDVDSYMGSVGTPVIFRFVFQFVSDLCYSDEDGVDPTACGAFALDSYSVTGNVTDDEDFEAVDVGSLPAAWSHPIEPWCGDFAAAKHLDDLPIPITAPPCGPLSNLLCSIQDSVLVLYDAGNPGYRHPLCQHNYAMSPVIDFSAHPDLPGRFFHWERFADLPLTDHVFMYWQVRHRPGCASGAWSSWVDDNYLYYTPEGAGCSAVGIDVSSYVPPQAQQVQVGLGVVNYCDEDPWGLGCSHACNVTPYYDNVTFGVFGSDVAPYVSMREIDYWQDQFAEDGTLNPSSTADTRVAVNLGALSPPIFGDTLVCTGAADNMEVYFVFRMAKVGPWQSTYHSFFSTWFPGVTDGGWREARMDTAEVTSGSGTYTEPAAGQWMCAFHEQDPVRVANGLPEGREILPNNVFVPGTRIEYFLKAKYAGSSDWFAWPDTAGGNCEEFEVLPMMRNEGGSARWPCLIVADHFGQRGNSGERNADRIARHLHANNFDFDVFTKLGPTSNLKNGLARWSANSGQVGGPGTDKYNWGPGATSYQMSGYTHCILNTGNVTYHWCVEDVDASLLKSWMGSQCGVPGDPRWREPAKFLWVSGDQVCRALSNAGGNRWQLLNNYLCASYTLTNRSYSQKSGDNTYCLPMNGVVGGRLSCPEPELYYVRENACPGWYNVLNISTASGCGGMAEVEYNAGFDGTTDVAAVSNVLYFSDAPIQLGDLLWYMTLVEGYDFCQMRTDAELGPLSCGSDDFLTEWIGCVLDWARYPHYGDCPIGCYIAVDDPMREAPAVTSLGGAFPNPVNPEATIRYTLGESGRATLRIFDVTGRAVRTLVDAEQQARSEPYEALWDGRDNGGRRVPGGVYFYQLVTQGYRSAKKIVILY